MREISYKIVKWMRYPYEILKELIYLYEIVKGLRHIYDIVKWERYHKKFGNEWDIYTKYWKFKIPIGNFERI